MAPGPATDAERVLQLQEELKAAQACSRSLESYLSSSDIATIVLDTNLRVRFFTAAARKFFNLITLGRPFGDLLQRFADVVIAVRTVLETALPTTCEFEAENGTWCSYRVLPRRTTGARAEGVVITISDISDRKNAEVARARAESINTAKSRFLAAASHDLRQPLQALHLMNGLLVKKVDDPEALRLVARGEETLAAMSGMLDVLLDINQLESGVARPNIIDFPINELLERLSIEFAYHAQARGLSWCVVPSRLAVRTDPRLLEQLIRNFLSNAMKYTDRGSVLLGCRRRLGGGVRVEVWDTGIGIPEAQLPRIFEEFHQIERSEHAIKSGMGLGLAIVQRLANLLGHTVDVRSRPGRGSVFAVEMMRADVARMASTRARPDDAEIAKRTGSILIAEDDPILREMLRSLLRMEGHETAEARDREEAMELVSRKQLNLDLAIVNYDLRRGPTGLQVIEDLRTQLGWKLPALVITADISANTSDAIARAGHTRLAKPVRASHLARAVRQLLSRPPTLG